MTFDKEQCIYISISVTCNGGYQKGGEIDATVHKALGGVMLIGTRSTSRDVLFSLLQVTQVNKPKHCITSTLVDLGLRCAVADDVL